MLALAVDLGNLVQCVSDAVNADSSVALFAQSFPQFFVLLSDRDFLGREDQQARSRGVFHQAVDHVVRRLRLNGHAAVGTVLRSQPGV